MSVPLIVSYIVFDIVTPTHMRLCRVTNETNSSLFKMRKMCIR